MSIHEAIESFKAVAQRMSEMGAICKLDCNETLLSVTGATTQALSLIPAGSIPLGVVARNLTSILGCTSYHVGDGTSAQRWGGTVSNAINTETSSADFTPQSIFPSAAMIHPTLTAVGSNFGGGNVRLSAFFLRLTAAQQ